MAKFLEHVIIGLAWVCVIAAGAGFPGPETQAESAAVSLYLTWLHAYAVWARHGWGRAADARAWCSTPR